MKTFPPVAVITPIYNGAAYLREAMAAVQSQTYANLTHFVLDNASTDATPQIIEEFSGSRVPVLVARNEQLLPQCRNWNEAVAQGGKGTAYFRILCADDEMPPESIEKMVSLAESHPDINVVASLRETSDGMEDFGWDKNISTFDGKDAIAECLLNGNGLAPPHVLYRTAATERRQFLFDESTLSFDTDAVFYLLSLPNAKLGFLHEPLAFTRRHNDSVTESEVNATHTDYFDWHVLVDRYGPVALGATAFAETKRSYRRHYLRRMAYWRIKDRNTKAFGWHMAQLRSCGQPPKLREAIDALADYGLCKFGIRSRWTKYPQG